MESNTPQDFVQAFANGLKVIRAFDKERPRMTLSQVAAHCNMTRAMARRLLWTLEKLGYVGVNKREFYLRPSVLELGYAYLSSEALFSIAQPLMEALVEKIHESCSMSVLDGDDIIYVLRIPTKRIMKISLSVGSRLPAYATSMGRVLLGGLNKLELDEYLTHAKLRKLTEYTITDIAELRARIDQSRDQRWAIVNQELELGLCSAAVPIIGTGGKIIAAINVGIPSAAVGLGTLQNDILPPLRATASEIMKALTLQPAQY